MNYAFNHSKTKSSKTKPFFVFVFLFLTHVFEDAPRKTDGFMLKKTRFFQHVPRSDTTFNVICKNIQLICQQHKSFFRFSRFMSEIISKFGKI